jgi:hypothetical protein
MQRLSDSITTPRRFAMQKVEGSSPFIRSSKTRWKRRVSTFSSLALAMSESRKVSF